MLVYVGVGALVAWRMYSRIRRVIGRQQLSNNRPKITIVVFTLLFGLLLFSALALVLYNTTLGAVALVVALLALLRKR